MCRHIVVYQACLTDRVRLRADNLVEQHPQIWCKRHMQMCIRDRAKAGCTYGKMLYSQSFEKEHGMVDIREPIFLSKNVVYVKTTV